MYLIIIHDLSVQQAWRLCLKCLGLPTHSPTQSVTMSTVLKLFDFYTTVSSVHNDTNGALINYNYSRSRYATNLYLNLLHKSNEFASKCCSFLSLWEMDSYFKVNRSELLSKLVRFKCSASLKSFSEAQDQRCQKHVSCCQVGLSLAFTSFTFYLCQDCY